MFIRDSSAARGINARWEQQALIVALALVVAVAIKVVGALLITAMLIIPAAAVRPFARTPEMVAILAAGRTKERVLARNGMFYAGSIMPLSLSCDHRVVDGAEGARFLQTVTDLLQDPDELLPEA